MPEKSEPEHAEPKNGPCFDVTPSGEVKQTRKITLGDYTKCAFDRITALADAARKAEGTATYTPIAEPQPFSVAPVTASGDIADKLEDDKIYSAAQICKTCGISRQTFQVWERDGFQSNKTLGELRNKRQNTGTRGNSYFGKDVKPFIKWHEYLKTQPAT